MSFHIITRTRLVQFWMKHSDAETGLRLWYKLTSLARWQNFVELRRTFPSADQVGNLTIFNIGGNKYRLITYVSYSNQKIYIRAVLTHAEYDRGGWKDDPWFKKQ